MSRILPALLPQELFKLDDRSGISAKIALRPIFSCAFSPSFYGRASRCGSSAPAWEIPREQSSKNLRASSPTMSCCRPRHTAKFAYAASPSPMPPRRLCLTVLASSCPSACALPCPSGKPSLRPPEPGPRPKCSDDFSAKALICPDPTPDSAQVGLILARLAAPEQQAAASARDGWRCGVGRPGQAGPRSSGMRGS